MVRSYAVFVLLLIVGSVAGQEVFRVPARFRSMGDASVSLQSPLSLFSNPAGIGSEKQPAFGVQYEKRFLLNELSTASAFVVLPVSKTNFGFSFSQFGQDLYRETKLSFAVAKRLSGRVLAALQFHYFNLNLPENREHAATLMVDIGAQYRLGRDFWIGAQLFNPYPLLVQRLQLEFDYPMVMRLGMHKVFDELILVAVDIRRQDDSRLGVSSGLELRIREQLQLRLGVETLGSIFSLGVGYSINRIQTDLAFSHHQYLGYSPSFSIYYQLP